MASGSGGRDDDRPPLSTARDRARDLGAGDDGRRTRPHGPELVRDEPGISRLQRRRRTHARNDLPDPRLADRDAPPREPDRLDVPRDRPVAGRLGVRLGVRDLWPAHPTRCTAVRGDRRVDRRLGLGPGIRPPVRDDPAVPGRPAAVAPLAARALGGVGRGRPRARAQRRRGLGLPGRRPAVECRGRSGKRPADDDLRCGFGDRTAADHPGGSRGHRGGGDQVPAHEPRRAAADQVARGGRLRRGRLPGPHELRHAAVPGRHHLGGPDHAARPDLDRDRDPALPPVRDRPDRQPHDRLCDPDGNPRCHVRGDDHRDPGRARVVHREPDHRCRCLDARRLRAVPAAAATRPERRRPALPPRRDRRRAHDDGLRGEVA